MAWARSFIPVPTGYLYVSPEINRASDHGYTPQDYRNMVAPVPAVYQRLASDGPAAYQAAPDAPESQTYQRLFADPSEHLRADFDGGRITVDKGNHRVLAARSADVPFLPVEVAAPDQQQLDQLVGQFGDIGGPEYAQALDVHANLEAQRVRHAVRWPDRPSERPGVPAGDRSMGR